MSYVARPVRADGTDHRPASPERRFGRTLAAVRRQMTPGVPYMVTREAGGWLEVIDQDGAVVDRTLLPAYGATFPVHYSPKSETTP